MRHSNDGSIDFPGGQMEWGESPIETLKREVAEELAYSLPGKPTFLDVWNYVAKDKSRHSLVVYYFLATDQMPKLEPTDEEPDASVVWMTKGELTPIIRDRAFLQRMFSK